MKNQKHISISPGDLLVVGLPGLQPNRKTPCSVRVLDRKPKHKDNFVGQIVDLVMVSTKGGYAPGEIVEIPQKSVLSSIGSGIGGHRAKLMVEISNGSVVGLSRVDGKTDPISVMVVDRDCGTETIFKVDAFSAETVAASTQETQEEQYEREQQQD